MDRYVDIVVIGAGQAGLAIGYYLKKSNVSFVLLDGSDRIGDVWRNRYDSLVLFSPRKYSQLPGLNLPGDPGGFPTKDELADYLEVYANHFSIPVQLNTEAKKLEKTDGKFRITTSEEEWTAEKVVVATGPFQKPFIPFIEKELPENVVQLHSSAYKNPSQIPEGNVLVIGGGNSGAQIAAELAVTHDVSISVSTEMVFIPRLIWKHSIFFWLNITQLSRVSVDSKLASYLQKTEPVIGMELKKLMEDDQVDVRERTMFFQGKEAVFRDGTKMQVDSVIWATGFYYDYDWIRIPGAVNASQQPIHQKGISSVENLYFLGLPWLSRVGSAQLNGINYDAKRIAKHLVSK